MKTQAKKGSNGPVCRSVRHSPAGSAAAESQAQLLQLLRLHCRSVLFLGRRGPPSPAPVAAASIFLNFFDSCCCPVSQRVHQRRGRCSHNRTKTRNRFVSFANPPFCLSGPRLDIIWLPAPFLSSSLISPEIEDSNPRGRKSRRMSRSLNKSKGVICDLRGSGKILLPYGPWDSGLSPLLHK